MRNPGFDKDEINRLRSRLQAANRNHEIVESEDNGPEYVNFNFVGQYKGSDVIYDAVIYTLRLQHNSEIFEAAEKKASERFPDFQKLDYFEDENGDLEELNDAEEEIGLFMAEVMMDLEEEETIKVQEHIEVDEQVNFGIGLDVGLNVDEVDTGVISKFVDDFSNDCLSLDPKLYSFQHQEEED